MIKNARIFNIILSLILLIAASVYAWIQYDYHLIIILFLWLWANNISQRLGGK